MQHLTRRDVLKLLGTLGLALPASSVLLGCDSNRTPFDGEVLIVGAGAAGMASGYLLAQAGLPFRILEASPRYGGRMKSTDSFVDFPIPLGAEWLHVSPDELRATVNDSSVEITTQTVPYQPEDTFGYAEDGTYEVVELADGDRKFVGATWLDFFEAYIVPSVESAMQFDTEITTVDYQTDRVVLTDRAGATYEADKVIVTVPMKILQQGRVTFAPELPARMQRAIREANIWSGIKVFLEFREAFYPTFLGFPDSMTDRGQRLYYDAAYGQNSARHVLGLFAVGAPAETYQALPDHALLPYMLAELDAIFDGAASQHFVQHIVQNWNEEPFIHGAYLADVSASDVSSAMARSVEDKVFFAGTAYTRENDWGGVHNATRSARDAVAELLR